MRLPVVEILSQAEQRRMRPTSKRIPPTRALRDRIRAEAAAHVAQARLVPPMPLADLRDHAAAVLEAVNADPAFSDYATVMVNNALWREQLASVPYERRLLLLPKCLRDSDQCPAQFDEFGLLCEDCGSCALSMLQQEAERLGYATLIAEGSAVVMAMLRTRRIDAIIGVSCLSVLEKSFPYMEASAAPGAAIPLLHDDCRDTNADLDWVLETISESSDAGNARLDLDAARAETAACFTRKGLAAIMGEADDEASQVAHAWLARDGKRWRPFLTACAWRAISGRLDPADPLPPAVRKLMVAVECFHKASLVHDDIEDGDVTRYGQPTVHAEHGVPIALNTGDLLIGEGYRLIGACGLEADRIARMVRIAAAGHRTLCLGQGAELAWTHAADGAVLPPQRVLEIFAQKTAPAFEVALRLAAAAAGAPDEVHEPLTEYSTLLGVAYQVRDDLEDWFDNRGEQHADQRGGDVDAGRLSIVLSLAMEQADEAQRQRILDLIGRSAGETSTPPKKGKTPHRPGNGEGCTLRDVVGAMAVEPQVRHLLESYKNHAIRSLAAVDNHGLKALLRQVMGRIFNEISCGAWRCEPDPADA